MAKQRTSRKRKPKQAFLTVAEAADVMRMTTSGVRSAIYDQRLPATRNEQGRIVVRRTDAEKFLRDKIAWWQKSERKRLGQLTEEEWVQQMWDNDPD